MDGSQLITCLIRWKMQLIYLKQKTNNFVTGLFMFDNAPSHQKQAPDALSARKMLKNPNQRWMSMKGGPRMWSGWYMNGSDKISQDFYFPNDHPEFPGWFKGMENIICEHGLWPNESDFEAIKNKSKICLNDLFILLKQSFL